MDQSSPPPATVEDLTSRSRRSPKPKPKLVAGVAAAVLACACVAFAVTAGGGERSVGQIRAVNLQRPSLPIPDLKLVGNTVSSSSDEDTNADADAKSDSDSGQLASGADSNEEVAAQLRKSLGGSAGSSTADLVSRASLNPDGTATVPPDAPQKVAEIINAGNRVATKPYVYGGGHGRVAGETWIDSAYDCSGSISFAFAAAGLIDSPMDSSSLAAWGKPGPGKWVTVYANAGHAWMTVAGLRFDTSGRQTTGSRWQVATRSTSGFTVVHPRGL